MVSASYFSARSTDPFQVRDRSIHRETAVGRDQSKARAACFFQFRFEIGHVVVLVAKALRFAEPDAVDDRGVIEFIANDRVFVAEQRFEQAAVGIEAGRVKNRVLGPEKFCQRGFEFLVNVLRAANEAHAGHAEAVGIERFLRRFDQRRMIGQPEIIVRAHVEDAFAAGDLDLGVLRTGDDALGLVKTLRFYFFERLRNLLFEFGEHWANFRQSAPEACEKNQKNSYCGRL